MGKRFNVFAVALVLAIASFAYGRYDYSNKHSATLSNPFGKHESTTDADPFMDKSLFGNWIKDEKLFAIILPLVFVAGGAVLSMGK